MSRQAVVRVLVTTQGRDLKTTLRLLENHGMIVDQVLDPIGVITGRIHESVIPKLEQVQGLTIERDHHLDIGPPDASPS